jgi:hypothetical protein
MNASTAVVPSFGSISALPAAVATHWFAVRTRSRHEKVVERGLQGQGLDVFYPVVNQVRQWSDRRKLVEIPLFAGYAFVRIAPTPEQRVRVLRTQGVVELVGAQGQGIPIPEDQIEAVRAVAALNLPFTQHVFLKVGLFPFVLKVIRLSRFDRKWLLSAQDLSSHGNLLKADLCCPFPQVFPTQTILKSSVMNETQPFKKPSNVPESDSNHIESSDEPIASLRSVRAETEMKAILAALKRTGWNRKQAARLLSISYRGLLYKIRRHNITAA